MEEQELRLKQPGLTPRLNSVLAERLCSISLRVIERKFMELVRDLLSVIDLGYRLLKRLIFLLIQAFLLGMIINIYMRTIGSAWKLPYATSFYICSTAWGGWYLWKIVMAIKLGVEAGISESSRDGQMIDEI